MSQMPVGLAVIEALRAEGIDTTFGIVGIASNSIVTQMHGRGDIRFIDTRHEEGAAFMAYGYSRASGKPTACIATSGAATTNLATGIALAHKGRAPVMVITGDTPTHFANRDGHQSLDLVEIFKPITQLAVQVPTTERILEFIRYGFRKALTGRTGPVLISIPHDLLDGKTTDQPILPPSAYRATVNRVGGDPELIERAAALLLAAERPLLFAGGGVIDSEATPDMLALADELDMALAPSWSHHDTSPNSHAMYVGPPGFRGAPEAMEAVRRCDAMLALGARISQTSTFWNDTVLTPSTKVVQIELDPHEIGRHHSVELGVIGDARTVARQLLEAVRRLRPHKKARPEWRAEIAALVARRRARQDEDLKYTGSPIMPHRVFTELKRVLPKNAMINVDAGNSCGLGYDRCHFEEPRTMFNYSGQGGLGMGYCISLGTKLGRPDRVAVSLQGDGGFMYTIQEINTAVRFKIPHVGIVMNNNAHGAEKTQQQRNHAGRTIGVDLINPRFDKLAEVCGARGFYVERTEDIADTLRAAIAVDGPTIVEIPVVEWAPPPARGV